MTSNRYIHDVVFTVNDSHMSLPLFSKLFCAAMAILPGTAKLEIGDSLSDGREPQVPEEIRNLRAQ